MTILVFARAFLIIFLPLLVQGIDQNLFYDPLHDTLKPQPSVPLLSGDHLHCLDVILHVIILSQGSTYRIRDSDGIPIGTPTDIPTDDYYRVSPIMIVKTGRGIEMGLNNRLFRVGDANIPQDRVAFLNSVLASLHETESPDPALFPVLPINQFIHNLPPNKVNDKHLRILILPLGSWWHTNSHVDVIRSDKYFQLPPKAIVITPIGTFKCAAGQVVRGVGYPDVDGKLFEHYKKECIKAYDDACYARTNLDLKDATFIERCTKRMWRLVVESQKPVEFSPPRLQWLAPVKMRDQS